MDDGGIEMMEQPPPPLSMPPQDEVTNSSDDDGHHSDAMPEPAMEENDVHSQSRDGISSPPHRSPTPPKRKKLDVKDVFNQDDDDLPAKKKKLPLPGKEKGGKEKGGEDKRKHIKSLIDKIPTSKEELFAYPIDSSMVDTVSLCMID